MTPAAAASCKAAGSAHMLVVKNPEDGSIVGELASASPADIELALARATRAHRDRAVPAHSRAAALEAVAADVAGDAATYARIIATEGIKTIREAEKEVARCVVTLRLAAEEAKRIGGAVIPFDQVSGGQGRLGWFALKPAGVVVAITPFNDPLNLVAHKIGPAYALGAPVILKPHPQTPFSARLLVEAFHRAGAPEDMVQIVIGGSDAGAALVADARPRIVSFTGGRAAGISIARAAGFKRLLMELGGVGLVAVAADADLDRASDAIHAGAFWAAGQNCVHAQRIIADVRIVEGLRERLLARAACMRLGPKLDPLTDMGPLVDMEAAARAQRTISEAWAAGARILCGGSAEGTSFQPTWVEGLPTGHAMLREEVFAPISTLESAPGTPEILARIADADDAINAAIFTDSMTTAMATYTATNVGALIVNDSTDFRIDAMPFGGPGSAGMGREGVADAIDAMAEKKLFIMNRAER
jgi:glyceraldehyde-3-phosphate dehydrogenase (NADP+)